MTASECRELVAETEAEILATERSIDELACETAQAEASATMLEDRLATLRDMLAEQVRATYKDGTGGLLDAIFGSGSLGELASTLRYASEVDEYVASLIDEAETIEGLVAELEEALGVRSDELASEQEALLAEYQERELLLAEAEEKESSSASALISSITNTDSGDPPSEAADWALTKVGCAYAWGGSGPYSFDCSGLAMWAYACCGYTIPHNAQLQANRVMSRGNLVYDTSALGRGSLVFFGTGGSVSSVYHVGICLGDGRYVHASNYGVGVIVSDLSQASNYCGGGSPV